MFNSVLPQNRGQRGLSLLERGVRLVSGDIRAQEQAHLAVVDILLQEAVGLVNQVR